MGGFFMQKIRHNKFVAMLLTLVMALSLLSVTAFAEDGAVAASMERIKPILRFKRL